MQKIIMLTFRGNTFYFVDKGFDDSTILEIQSIADDVAVFSKQKSENEICNLFIETVKEDLDVQLEPVEISHIIRIKI